MRLSRVEHLHCLTKAGKLLFAMLVAIADRDKQLGYLADCPGGLRADCPGTAGEICRPLAGQAMDTQTFKLFAEALVEAHLRVEQKQGSDPGFS